MFVYCYYIIILLRAWQW